MQAILTAFLFLTGASAIPKPQDNCILVGGIFGCFKATEKDLAKTPHPGVTRIILSQSTIPTIKKEFFTNFPVLTDFDCNGNEIETIEDDAFQNTALLKYVGFSDNRLKRINPDVFQNCPNIFWFNVSDNANLTIPNNEPFLNAPHLQVLDLQRCNIEKLFSITFKNLTGLTFLSLAGNNIKVLPDDVFKPLNNLEILDLSDNKMETISLQVFADIRPLFLFLAGNPWECDCALYPVIQWIASFLVKEEITCVKPYDKKWRDVVLNCPKSTITEVWNNFYKGI